jgi:cell division protein FtsQ
MKKVYKFFFLFVALIFLSTFNPNLLDFTQEKESDFFKIETIEITNNYIIKNNEINKKLKQVYGKNIFLINKKDILIPLQGTYFLKGIEVKKKYPKTIALKVFETKPIAILYKDNTQFILDNSSNLVPLGAQSSDNNLPNVFGKNAEHNFVNFLKLLEKNNFNANKIKNYYFFQVGRWDLEFRNNQIIKLPYNKIQKAIKKSVELLKRKDFENYKIIDLRVEGKIIVE